MNIVEKEAIRFSTYFFEGQSFCDIDYLKSTLSSKLYNFNRDKDKLYFLNVLRKEVELEKLEHEKKCTTIDCDISTEKKTGFFVIDQEIDNVNRNYEFEPYIEDKFKIEEQVDLHNKLNQIEEQLKNLGYGQEVIYNEIDELKENFNLGKKNWFQLAKGKFLDLTVSKLVEETVIKEIYSELSKGFKHLPKLIDNLQ
ncbi:hypothetical protein [Flavobacterium ammonificans]|uniref:Uncharacterized protein n=1 Tax=Flavobacterium ammonificans TaxID=1751056 RepID=A0ABN6KVD6_9FLAO|nr:hypothetical protein [Flavobacterium ammonificans]BDB53074.1 hypothetical protein GENT11_13860 [Flavobacterium ammonificans]